MIQLKRGARADKTDRQQAERSRALSTRARGPKCVRRRRNEMHPRMAWALIAILAMCLGKEAASQTCPICACGVIVPVPGLGCGPSCPLKCGAVLSQCCRLLPTPDPTPAPSASPTKRPTPPTAAPTATPSVSPTVSPTATPTVSPTATPSVNPTVHAGTCI